MLTCTAVSDAVMLPGTAMVSAWNSGSSGGAATPVRWVVKTRSGRVDHQHCTTTSSAIVAAGCTVMLASTRWSPVSGTPVIVQTVSAVPNNGEASVLSVTSTSSEPWATAVGGGVGTGGGQTPAAFGP